MAEDQGQKTEKATPTRLQKARKDGRFPTSRDLVAAVHLSVGVLLAFTAGAAVLSQLQEIFVSLFKQAFLSVSLTPGDVIAIYRKDLLGPVMFLAEKGFLVAGATLLVQMVTTGFGFSTKQLTPDLNRLNPASRLKSLPKQNLSSALKALVLLPFIFFVLYEEIGQRLPDLANLAAQPLGSALIQSEDMMASLFRRLVIALLVIGIVDFVRQKQRFAKELRMSKQEIKDESKEAQGDPQIKMRIRRLQRDAMRRSMMKNIPKATAVIVNPTHYAIAIQYEMHSKAVPLVVAKGRNYLALVIKQKAIEHEIPIVENKPLAQALYQAVDVGQEIPSHLYRAVAEVLAYVYRTINRR